MSHAPRPGGLAAWRLATRLVAPLAPLILRQRAVRGKEDRARIRERLGHAAFPRPQGRLVWVHGASVGESLSVLPLIERLTADGFAVLATSGTVTSAAMLAKRLPPGAIHQYVPLDLPRAVARFLDHWRPEAGLFVESDLWPNLIGAAQARGVKLALVNARMSEASAQSWRRAPKRTRSRRCSRAKPTAMTAISRFTPARAAPKARTGPKCCSVCICAGPKSAA